MKDVGVNILNCIVLLVIFVVFINKFYNFDDILDHYINNSPNISSYYTQNITNMPIVGAVANKGTKSFGNFSKFGDIPMMQFCSECKLHDNCVTPDYKKSNKHKNVCLKCGDFLNNNRTNLNKPIYVGAKSAGRGRQCRIINT
jgi:hypothetical protein